MSKYVRVCVSMRELVCQKEPTCLEMEGVT